MQNCQGCQDLLLEYLYDLVDDADRKALLAHLEGCPACQAALTKVRQQQGLLAAAAKLDCAAVKFVAPAQEPAAPQLLPLPKPAAAKRSPWRRWIAAAAMWLMAVGALQWVVSTAVMVVVFAVVGLAVWFGSDYVTAENAVARQEIELAQLDQQKRAAETKANDLEREARQKIEDIQKDHAAKELRVSITGPATVQAGAPATYQINATDLNNQPTKANIAVQLMDQGNKLGEPIKADATANTGKYVVHLPADLPVKQNSRLAFVVTAKRAEGSKTELPEEIQLAAAPVYLTHLTTDKPMYQPGEVVQFRSLTLDRATLKPAQEELRFNYVITTPLGEKKSILQGGNALMLTNAAGAGVLANGPDRKPIRGVGAGSYYLDEGAAGGEYTLTLVEEFNRFPAQERKFIVNRYQKPQLNKELDFSQKTYGAGDDVSARCKATDTKNDPVKNKPVTATVQIDGKTYGLDGKESSAKLKLKTDDEGAVNVRFKLPKDIDKGQASLSVTFEDGANVETLVRPIPLVLKKLNVEFFPEGGDLVAGLENRVYFQVRTPLDKAADLKGRLLDDGTPTAVELQTLTDAKEPGVNQGMGVFAFTPKFNHKYEVQVDAPANIAQKFVLPEVKVDGVVLTIDQSVVAAEKPIKVKVQSRSRRSLMIGAYCRGQLLDTLRLDKGQTEATLNPATPAGGVCRVTVFEELGGQGNGRRALKPVAERLIYREPSEKLLVVLRPDQSSYLPGQKVGLTVEALNEQEKATPALVMLSVVDKRVVTMADEKTYRSMPTHFLLTSEVRRPEDLEYADFLIGSHPKARTALDLLLGTQGWRRFAEQDPAKFRQQHKDAADAERLLCSFGQSEPLVTDFVKQEIAKVEQHYNDDVLKLQETQTKAAEKQTDAKADLGYVAALAKVAQYRRFFMEASRWIYPGLGVLLLLVAIGSLVLGLRRHARRAMPYFAVTALSAVALLVGLEVYLSGLVGGQMGQMAVRSSNEKTAVMAPAPNLLGMEPRDAGNAEDEGGRDLDRPRAERFAPAVVKDVAEQKAGDKTKSVATATGVAAANKPVDALPDLFAGKKEDRNALLNQLDAPKQLQEKFDDQFERLAKLPEAKLRKEAEEAKRAVAGAGFMPAPAGADGRRLPGGGGGGRGGFGRPGPGGLPGQPLAPVPFGPAGEPRFDGRDAGQQLPPLPPIMVREYAHQHQTSGNPDVRQDFAETLYWHPVLVLPDGKNKVSFDLCDSVTTFQVTAFAHTLDGRLGSAMQTFDARLPFTLEPKVPVEVTSSDKIDIPLSIVNNGGGKEKVHVNIEAKDGLNLLRGAANAEFDVQPGTPLRRLYRFQPTITEGRALVTFAGKAGAFTDSSRNSFTVVPEGFPFVGARSDLLEGSASQTVTLPDTWVAGTLKLQANVYPSTLADLQKGLDSLLREPNGCFEQTSTTNYPNLLILDYLKTSDQTKPEVERKARDLVARGYQKLTSFECTNQSKNAKEGYEWFGGTAPAHEALTAYGLLQFRDMAKVQEVDPQMLERTKQYLLAQRDGKGGFKRNPQALDTFGRAPDDITNAYIIWALTEGGKDDDITTELNKLNEQAQTSKDPYFLSLVANSLINRAKTADAVVLLKKVGQAQQADGHLDAERTSITGSGGRDLQIETTSLAVLGWLKGNPGEFNGNVQKAIKWIGQQRGGYGGFGSTQSTILALKALIAYTKANKRTAEAGELKLFVGDREVAKQPFAAGAADALTLNLPNAEEVLKPGANNVRVEISGKNTFPYTLTWTYSTLKPASAENCPVFLATKLAHTEVKEGDSVRLTVNVENKSGKGQGMAVAIVGLPGGLTVPEDMKQLKEYIAKPVNGGRPLVSAFEIRGRELILYWRDLAPDQKIEVPIDLICRVPGEFSGPASRAYLYYNADLKHWIEPLKMTIAAKE